MRAILTFHSIDDSGAVLAYSPVLFEQLLVTLAAKRIPVLDLETLLQPSTTRGVALTFDDGMRSVYTVALPLLQQYNAVAHVYLTPGVVGKPERWPADPGVGQFEMLNWDEVSELQKAGIFMDAHTQTHPDMRKLSLLQLEEECAQSDDTIRRYTGRMPRYLAYPFGYHDRQVRNYVRSRYLASVTTELAYLDSCKQLDSAAIPRLDSYYIRSNWMIGHLDSLQVRNYLRARSVLRTVRGSQCIARTV